MKSGNEMIKGKENKKKEIKEEKRYSKAPSKNDFLATQPEALNSRLPSLRLFSFKSQREF